MILDVPYGKKVTQDDFIKQHELRYAKAAYQFVLQGAGKHKPGTNTAAALRKT